MTLSSFLGPSYGFEKPSVNERGDHVHYHSSWKGGGSKGAQISQSAISALTLLAFLFFLNILQTCLKDQLQSQSPLVIMMTTQTTTTTTEGQRHKRSSREGEKQDGVRHKGDTQEERNKSSEDIGFKTKVTKQFSIKKEGYFKKEILKKSKNYKAQQIFTSLEAREHSYSPWLQSVICCKILSCQKTLQEETVHHYSNYLRKLINYLCYSTKAVKKNSCTKCFKSHQEY
ncbi:uncharacterized protein [Halyomorpha halys]|uniref:uncharacterized protein n=1 Tax=Halyomorpha halys TaxID=286706 RepID=UPI0006D4E2D1|nr:uncharacterized protein LOC106687051 [Halyomorpha halys]